MRLPSRNLLIVATVLAAALAAVAYEVRQRALYLGEEDARIRADMVTVSSRVAGWVTHRAVREGQAVAAGAALVTIDPRDGEQALAELAAQRAALPIGESRRAAEIDARIRSLRLDLEDRVVRSTSRGVIDRTFVEPGEYVGPGQRLLLMHDPAGVWIEAHIKETQLRRVAVGQRVRVRVDAYPDEKFEGRVEQIGHATTSTFALLPTPNPSGNFTKITQRVPVRIAIAQRDGKLRPGMMVELRIATGG